jgi:DNA polymerase-4
VKYRDEDFHTVTRAETMETATDAGDRIFEVAWRLFQKAHGRRKVRLLGVSLSGFVEGPQRGLFAEAGGKGARADALRDVIRERFGGDALTRASLLSPPGAPRGPRR